MKNILSIVVALLIFSSCEEKPHDIVEPLTRYAMLNKSGVTVAIVPKGSHLNIPDSLVLLPGMSFLWSIDRPYVLSGSYDDPVKVYFDKTIVVNYTDFPREVRDPRQGNQYIGSLVKDGLKYNVYIFTVEDYERAVEQNNAKK